MSGKLRLIAEQLRISIVERNRLLELDFDPIAENDDEIKHTLRTLYNGIRGLDDNGRKYKTDELQDDIAFLKHEFRELKQLMGAETSGLEDDFSNSGITPPTEAYRDEPDESRKELLPERLRKNVRFTDALVDPDVTNEELLQRQSQIMNQQDGSLDNLSLAILRQRELSIQIGDELDEHGGLLDEVGTMVDHSSTRLDQAKQKLNKFSSKAKENSHLLTIFVLILILVLLLAVL